MQSHEIRGGFLDFFAENGHRIVPSSSLVPGDDPTLLFTNAGMNQFKDVFLGKESRPYRRATTSQKCMRVSGKHNDLDNVGPSHRHHTFFEMLGNFSFGDYFKAEAIEFAWRVLTDVWKLEPGRLHATVFAGEAGILRDGDAYDLWRRVLPTGRIARTGARRQFLADGRDRTVWPVFGDPFLPSGATLPARDVPRHRVRLRPLHRDLEQRLHGVRPSARRRAQSAAGAVDRHGHGPRADRRGDSGEGSRTTTPTRSRPCW